VSPGKVVGVIGPNGAGKTTLIDSIGGLNRHYTGSVTLDGQSLDGDPPYRRAQRGVLRSFQGIELFDDLTVEENLLVASDRESWWKHLTDLVRPGKPKLSGATLAAVEEFGLADYLERLPEELPYGKRRLTSVAQALAGGGGVLLLDEPAAGLDRRESQELGVVVRRLADDWGLAILLVEHDVDLVMSICEEIVVLNFGEQIAKGPADQVRNDPAVRTAYLGETERDSPELVGSNPASLTARNDSGGNRDAD